MQNDALAVMTAKLWRHSFLVAFAIWCFFVVYITILDRGFGLGSFTKTFAGTANFLFAMSLSLSSFGYYFNFLDSKVVYRKYLGLLGYFSALCYSLLLPVANPERYFYGFWENFFTSDYILGLLSMGIFTAMALVSNNRAMLFLGPKLWRSILRLGYVAFFLLVIRAVLNQDVPVGVGPEAEMWVAYVQNPDNLPPPRMLFSVVAMAVILFRLSVEFDKWRQRGKPALASPGTVPSPMSATVAQNPSPKN